MASLESPGARTLSTATIRNVMADLEDGGFLYQPHTSAGRVPTAAAYRFFAQEIASQATISIVDKEWIRREFSTANNRVEITERAGHVLAEVSNGLGIVVSPPLGRTVLEHARIWLLPDGRVMRGVVRGEYFPGLGEEVLTLTGSADFTHDDRGMSLTLRILFDEEGVTVDRAHGHILGQAVRF